MGPGSRPGRRRKKNNEIYRFVARRRPHSHHPRTPAARAQTPDVPGVTEHIANATKAAKTDLLGPLGLCKTATPENGPDFMANYNEMKKKPPLAPAQVMDDLYFLGNYWTSAWAIKTSAGLIIIDALDNASEAKEYIEGGLRKV